VAISGGIQSLPKERGGWKLKETIAFLLPLLILPFATRAAH